MLEKTTDTVKLVEKASIFVADIDGIMKEYMYFPEVVSIYKIKGFILW